MDVFTALQAIQLQQGGPYWSRNDQHKGIEHPVSTLRACLILGALPENEAAKLQEAAVSFLFESVNEQGKFQIGGNQTHFPCHTALCAFIGMRAGMQEQEAMNRMQRWLLEHRHQDGGWRCNRTLYGSGEETQYSNPFVTLCALYALKDTQWDAHDAVETLLHHWDIKSPIGPCHYGMGTQFFRIEYPMMRYNILTYVYVLSYYEVAQKDVRFQQAKQVLDGLRQQPIQMSTRWLTPFADADCWNISLNKTLQEIEDNCKKTSFL